MNTYIIMRPNTHCTHNMKMISELHWIFHIRFLSFRCRFISMQIMCLGRLVFQRIRYRMPLWGQVPVSASLP